jgi:hypothetical protein
VGTEIKDGIARLKVKGTLKGLALRYKIPVADVK